MCVLVKKYGHCDSRYVGVSVGLVSRWKSDVSTMVVAMDPAGHRSSSVAVPPVVVAPPVESSSSAPSVKLRNLMF